MARGTRVSRKPAITVTDKDQAAAGCEHPADQGLWCFHLPRQASALLKVDGAERTPVTVLGCQRILDIGNDGVFGSILAS